MFLRSAPTDTLSDLMDNLDEPTLSMTVNAADIRIDHEQSMIVVGTREFPTTEEGILSIGNWLDVPTPFLKRMDDDLQQHLLNAMLHRRPANIIAKVTDDGIKGLRDLNNKDIEPRRVVETAARVIGAEAPIVGWQRNNDLFQFDVVVPDHADFGIGGDPNSLVEDGRGNRVGDVTKGGLRFGQDVRRNLAPWVQPYMYRLVCTNGMEMRDDGLKVDARGNTVDEVLAELEAAAQRAFARVESDIAHFYDLRHTRLDNPERHFLRLANERNLPERSRNRLMLRIPSIVSEDGTTSEFDLVNLITNAANDPAVTRWGARQELERFGGHIVTTQVERCRTCQGRLD